MNKRKRGSCAPPRLLVGDDMIYQSVELDRLYDEGYYILGRNIVSTVRWTRESWRIGEEMMGVFHNHVPLTLQGTASKWF